VKRYVREVGTSWVRRLTRRGKANEIYIAGITAVEVTSAVARRRRGRSVSSRQASSMLARFREHLAVQYTVVEVTPVPIARAMTLANRHELRAYDAVQLAAAIEVNGRWILGGRSGIVLVSADDELNKAARVEGLTVEDPNLYP
jgi:uncharacterized protein